MGKKSSRKKEKLSKAEKRNPQNSEKQYTENVKAADLKPMTKGQAEYINAINSNILTFGTGPAGTGKSYIAGFLAAQALIKNKELKLYITRPAQEAGESLGFLPGEIDEKFEPYFRPFRDVLIEALGKGRVDYFIKSGRIEAVPLAYMRGMTMKDAWIILDEGQNTTPVQMKLFLTRIGENTKVIINGDYKDQLDINGRSGLEYAVTKLKGLEDIAITEFTTDDIVRSGLVQKIVERLAA